MKKIITLLLFFSIISLSLAQVPTRKGWWKFDDTANLTKAEIGTSLDLVGAQVAVTGPADGNGAVSIGVGSHYKMYHGITPKAGQTKVNEYTLQFDVRVKDNTIWHSLFQTAADNSNDGDCFIDYQGLVGVRATGYTTYAVLPNEWYRIIVSVKNGSFYRYYIDGKLALEGTVQAIDDRFGLETVLLAFGDEDGEDNEIECAELGIWDVALTGSQVYSLGGFGHNVITDPMTPAGLWKFENSANFGEASYGSDCTLVGTATAVEGPASNNNAMEIGVGSYLKCEHGFAANGGGTKVNEFTMKFDFKVTELNKWRTFFQLNPANSDDGDCFINKEGAIGTQATGYGGYKVVPNEWYRLVISVKNGTYYRYYLDGQLLLEATVQTVDGRFSLDKSILFFGDDDGDDGTIDVSEVAIWDRSLSESEAKSLGGYGHNLTGGGSATKALVGNWKFDNPFDLLTATVGQPLELVGTQSSADGPTSTNFATRIGVGSYYKMNHKIEPNGGGALVNGYSLMFDFKVLSLSGWHCFFQTSALNANDGDCFINSGGNIGLSATGYSAYSIKEDEWYRMIVSVQNGTSYKIYLDGSLILDGAIQAVDGRFALDPTLLVFADEDGEDGEIDCAELSIWNYALTAAEIKTIGGYGHIVGIEDQPNSELPTSFELTQNYPNPFNPETKINYALPKSGVVSIKVYDVLGKEVATLQDGFREAGYHTVKFDGSKLASGIYFYRMVSGSFTSTKKLLLLK